MGESTEIGHNLRDRQYRRLAAPVTLGWGINGTRVCVCVPPLGWVVPSAAIWEDISWLFNTEWIINPPTTEQYIVH